MLTNDTITAFVAHADTRKLADVLIGHSLIGTDVGDRVLACVGNDSERGRALATMLADRNAWESAA